LSASRARCSRDRAQRIGIRSDPLGAAGTVAVAGAILAVSAHWSHLTEARTYALLVGAVGLTNIGWGLVRAKPTT